MRSPHFSEKIASIIPHKMASINQRRWNPKDGNSGPRPRMAVFFHSCWHLLQCQKEPILQEPKDSP